MTKQDRNRYQLNTLDVPELYVAKRLSRVLKSGFNGIRKALDALEAQGIPAGECADALEWMNASEYGDVLHSTAIDVTVNNPDGELATPGYLIDCDGHGVYLLSEQRVLMLDAEVTAPPEEIAAIVLEPGAYYGTYDVNALFNHDDEEWTTDLEGWAS